MVRTDKGVTRLPRIQDSTRDDNQPDYDRDDCRQHGAIVKRPEG